MNKKTLTYILTIIAVSTATFTATQALLSDTTARQGNTFSVGTLELEVTSDSNNSEPIVIENLGIENNSSGTRSWIIKNKGSISGKLGFGLENIFNNENGCNEPESKVDITCDDPGTGQGELGNTIYLTISLNGQEVVTSPLNSLSTNNIKLAWENLQNTVINGGEEKTITLDWNTDHQNYGNEVQSDSLTFDVWFDLKQFIN